MKSIQHCLPVIVIFFVLSCNSAVEEDTAGSGSTAYNTIAQAAAAAKVDMLAILDSVPLGFAKDSLSAASPGTPIPGFNIDMKSIITANAASTFDSLPKLEFPMIVPFVGKDNRVVTVVSINKRDGKYAIGQLVNYPLSINLNQVMAMNTSAGASLQSIIQVYAVQATIFVAKKQDSVFYYYGFNNNNTPTRALSGRALLDTLKKESEFYLNKYGDDKGKYW
jgi:hypothetical protein